MPEVDQPQIAGPRNEDGKLTTPTIRQWHWIGNINRGMPTQGYVGAKCMYFRTLREFNNYFSDNEKEGRGMLLIEATYIPHWWGTVSVVALVTNQVDPEEMEEMDQSSRRIEIEMAAWRQKRAEAKAEEYKVEQAAKEEVARLARVGSQCEKNHKHNLKLDTASKLVGGGG